MKIIFTIFFTFVLFVGFSFSQIPNPGFENWTNGLPTGWDTTGGGQSSFSHIIQSTDAHSGNYSVEGNVYSYFGFTFSPAISSSYFSMNSKPTDFNGYFKFNSDGGDSLAIYTILYSGGTAIGTGDTIITSSYSNWTNFDAKISYISSSIPDSAWIWIYVSPIIGSHANTVFYLDDLSYSGSATSVKEQTPGVPVEYKLYPNYPNPFNPSTRITFDNPKSGITRLDIYNSLGQKISTLYNGKLSAGEHTFNWNAVDYPSGIYIYRISSGNFNAVRKMILLK